MLLVFLNFNLDIGAARIGLIPTFIGYIFLVIGLGELIGFSPWFSKVMPFAKVMVVCSGILYGMDLFGITARLGVLVAVILGFGLNLIGLYISYGIVVGIKDIETTKGQDLNAGSLYRAWKLLAIFSIMAYLLLPILVLAAFSVIASFVVGIYYLYVLNKTRNLFYLQNLEG